MEVGIFMTWKPNKMQDQMYESFQWQPRRSGLYESNYLKANSPDGQRAIWIKHNILAWSNPLKEPIVELWCIFFEKGKQPRVLKQELPTSQVKVSPDKIEMKGKDIFLSPQHTTTILRDKDKIASWDIEMISPSQGDIPIVHFRYAKMYEWKFPKKKILTPAPYLLFNGHLQFMDEKIIIHDWIGSRNHNWGTEHAFQYAYGNCNYFPDTPNVLFDGFSAKLRVGLLKTPFLTSAIIRENNKDYPFNSLALMFLTKTIVKFPRWEIFLQNKTEKAHIIQEGEPDDFVGLSYYHPDEKISYCYNTKWAKTTIHLKNKNGEEKRFRSDFGELEFLYTKPLKNILIY